MAAINSANLVTAAALDFDQDILLSGHVEHTLTGLQSSRVYQGHYIADGALAVKVGGAAVATPIMAPPPSDLGPVAVGDGIVADSNFIEDDWDDEEE